MTVQRIEAKDLTKLTELFDYGDVDAMIDECIERMKRGVEDIFVLLEKDILVGELHAMYDSEDERFAKQGKRVYLFAFRVKENFQHQGFGTHLLKTVLSILQEKGYSEFTIGVEDENHRAKHLYQTFGFTEFLCRKRESFQGDSYEFNLYLKRYDR